MDEETKASAAILVVGVAIGVMLGSLIYQWVSTVPTNHAIEIGVAKYNETTGEREWIIAKGSE